MAGGTGWWDYGAWVWGHESGICNVGSLGVELEQGGVGEVWRNFAGKLGRIVPPMREEETQSMTTLEGITGG